MITAYEALIAWGIIAVLIIVSTVRDCLLARRR
jgi:hypothetical protein